MGLIEGRAAALAAEPAVEQRPRKPEMRVELAVLAVVITAVRCDKGHARRTRPPAINAWMPENQSAVTPATR
jgi:hypothetical protein